MVRKSAAKKAKAKKGETGGPRKTPPVAPAEPEQQVQAVKKVTNKLLDSFGPNLGLGI